MQVSSGRTSDLNRSASVNSTTQSPQIVILAQRRAVYECLTHAARQHFTGVDVSFFEDLPPGRDTGGGARLVLIGPGVHQTASGFAACERHFPQAAFALLAEHGEPPAEPAIIESDRLKGILSLSLPLDVWLAVASLLLSGGQYFSQIPRRPEAVEMHQPEAIRVATPNALEPMEQPDRGDIALSCLTTREREILQLVSEGFQNKLIADRMSLSEHTVKAHVHNLIAKLRVTNRTQAAAYLHRRGQISGGSPETAQPRAGHQSFRSSSPLSL